MVEICHHNVVELFQTLEEVYESDLARNSDVLFRMTLNAATHYNHEDLITRMLADPHCQLNCLITFSVPRAVTEEMNQFNCYLKDLKIVEANLSAGKVRILKKK